MKTLTEGHRYELSNFDNKDAHGQIVQFIEKKPKKIEDLIEGDEIMVCGNICKFVELYKIGDDISVISKNKSDVSVISSIEDSKVVTLSTINNGTTNEEVLKMLIDRMNFLQSQFPCRENAIVITKLEESLMWLEKRTIDRTVRSVEGKQLK